jgi:hypothetical protein
LISASLEFKVIDEKKGAFANAFVQMLEEGAPIPQSLCEMVKGIHAHFASPVRAEGDKPAV